MFWRCSSVLAVIGVFSLFAGAAGILRLAGPRDARHRSSTRSPTARRTASWSPTRTGRVVYANAAYLTLVDAVDADDVRPVERVFVGDPQVSEAIYRLAKASREGRPLQEEVRVPGAERRRRRAGCASACGRLQRERDATRAGPRGSSAT